MIESLLYAEMPPHLKKSINQAYLERGAYVQIIKHIEEEMELNVPEVDEPLVKTQMPFTKKKTKTLKLPIKDKTTKPKKAPKTVPV